MVMAMALQPPRQHPHGLGDGDFDEIFTRDKPVNFAHHGYPTLTYRRTNRQNFHVHGYKVEGTTTTPFDMAVLNEIDRFHLAMDAVACRGWARVRSTLARSSATSPPITRAITGSWIDLQPSVTQDARNRCATVAAAQDRLQQRQQFARIERSG